MRSGFGTSSCINIYGKVIKHECLQSLHFLTDDCVIFDSEVRKKKLSINRRSDVNVYY